MDQMRHNYYGIISITGVVLVLVTLGIEYFQFDRHQHLILSDLKHRLDEHSGNVNLEARTVQDYVQGLKIAAENSLFYIKEFEHTSFLFPFLKNSSDEKYFSLDIAGSRINKAAVGNLSGLGSLKTFSKVKKEEMNMALFLNTVFESVLKSNRGALWVYYISKNHFQNLYPWIPIDLETLSRDLSRPDLFQKASPEKNPMRLNFWTSAYRDMIADGGIYPHNFVVTNFSPIYEGNQFLGIVALDLSLAELNRIIDQFPISSGTLFLINKEHQVLATKGIHLPSYTTNKLHQLEEFLSPGIIEKIQQEIKNPTNWFSLQGSSVSYTSSLHQAPWFLVYVDSKSKLFLDAFYDALRGIFIISLILIFVVGSGYFLVIQNFISPAQKLMDHIRKENKGIKSKPQNLPRRWQSWFDIISRIFAENRTLLEDLENRVQHRTQQWKQKNQELEQALIALKKAKNQIIVQEKLASLGGLTAGIAHEIKNPLNFIINFTDLSLEYLHELKEKIPNEKELFNEIEQNMKKSREHAEKADAIVKTMLSHARGGHGEITDFDLNKLLSQTIDLALFGFQGQEHHFTAKITKNFDEAIGNIEGFESELIRVFLNIANNAFFSMNEKRTTANKGYQPELIVTTKDRGSMIEILFQDNGKGMSPSILNKIFNPFFTTKGAGKGTGLGLSLSHEIITRQHHGHIKAESKRGIYSRFILELPKKM